MAQHIEPEEEKALEAPDIAPRAPRKVLPTQEAHTLESLSTAHLGALLPKGPDPRLTHFKGEALAVKKAVEDLAHLPESLREFLGGDPLPR